MLIEKIHKSTKKSSDESFVTKDGKFFYYNRNFCKNLIQLIGNSKVPMGRSEEDTFCSMVDQISC